MKNKYLDSYIYYISIEKNLAKGTIESYSYELKTFFEYLYDCYNIDPNKDMVSIVEDDKYIKMFLFYLVNQKKNKKATVNRKITTLRNFFNYIASSKEFVEIKSTPMLNIKNQKEEKKLPIYLTIEECEKFLYGIKFFSRYATRDYAIFQVFLSTGARLSEITSLTLEQINLKNGVIKLYGKGNVEREVVLTKEALNALNKYLYAGTVYKKNESKAKVKDLAKSGRIPNVNTNIVFLNKYGKPFTPKGIYMLFRSLAVTTGIYKKGLSPHKMRHTFCTFMYSEGMDLMDIKKIAGHSSLRTTEIYTHVSSDVLNRVKDIHPLNRNSLDDEMIDKIKNKTIRQ
ncbi:MAG: tyrosine-type recombinase/integrase [Bacilli bacterium]|nr:tyrosine-type recombinase/integrase [Bacilli bacterium]